jgi:glycosyltransferase involved in cell wall biosynthesis
VLLAGDFPERPPLTIGGIQAVTWQLARALAQRGDLDIHTATCERFFAHAPPARRWRSRFGGIHAHYLRTPGPIPHVLSAWSCDAAWVRHQIAATRAQLVHAHGQVGYTIGAIRGGTPHVITPHGMLAHEKHAPAGASTLSRQRLRQELWSHTETWCLAHAKHIIVISPYVRALIEPLTSAQLHDIPNPVDPGFFALERHSSPHPVLSSSPRPVSSSPHPVLLSVGWLNARKRHELIIRAFALVRQHAPGARLHIVGNPEAGQLQHAQRLRQLVRDLDLGDAVQIIGGLSHAQLLQQYQRADLYVHAAAEESSPVAVAQAMAAGLPLCAVDIPGLHHLLADGHTGVYASEATAQALAHAIVKIINNSGFARTLGESARRQALSQFHPSVIASATAELYRAVLAEASQ